MNRQMKSEFVDAPFRRSSPKFINISKPTVISHRQSHMANNDLVAWTASQVQTLLPGLEGPYLQEAVKYSLTLPPEDSNRHWRSLLGSFPQVDIFLKELNERRNPPK